jgi:hypothetical protein
MHKISHGCTLHIDLPSPIQPHLFFVMTPPHGEPPVVVIVNISTVRGYQMEDHTVVLKPDDHPYIKHDSYVAYGYARKITIEVLEQRIEEGRATLMDRLSPKVFQRVLDGLLNSPETPEQLKSVCRRVMEQ